MSALLFDTPVRLAGAAIRRACGAERAARVSDVFGRNAAAGARRSTRMEKPASRRCGTYRTEGSLA